MNFHGKHALLSRLIRDHNCLSFVETGTYEAKMSLAMSEIVNDVRSIELSQTLHFENVDRVAKANKNHTILLINGHSAKELPRALEGAPKPLVWLDAHWSAGKTTRDDSGSDTPIVEELQALKQSDVDGVIAIDDMWCFNGTNGYPTYERLCELILNLWPTAVPVRDDEVVWFVTKG